jgi:hypothetical protein
MARPRQRRGRADLARHIAALANHGGGMLVLGITDAMQFAGDNPCSGVVCDRDLISSIVKKYLEPAFQCDVQVVKSTAGNDHPIVIVPPHGPAPVCAKAAGPMVGGKSKGIAQGVYYIRKPGPESAPIATGSERGPIIRRCAMHERASILASVDAVLRGVGQQPPTMGDSLKRWHDAAETVFIKDIADRQARSEWAKWHW